MMAEHLVKRIPEIEGLRAIAVISVVLFHAKFSNLAGGYIGVDVFFVISGYLITKVLWTELERENTISLIRFYAKRIARLAPALAIVSLLFSVIFSFLFPPVISEEVSASFILAQLSVSNFWFYFSTNYFADSTANPALHTWSLSVEEQFYVVLPLLLIIIAKFNHRQVIFILSFLCVISLIFASYIVFLSPSKAFYFPWLRAWELLFGSILAISKFQLSKNTSTQILTFSSLGVIVLVCIFYSEHTLFPGLTAVLPVLATGIVIASQGHQHPANRLLSLKPMQWLGKISYSVYLVHWPLVCMASSTVSLYPRPVRVAVVLGSILLGWASWKWIESPFRSRLNQLAPSRLLTGFFICNIAICAGIFAFAKAGQQYWTHFPNAVVLSEYVKSPTDFFRTGSCFLDGSPDGPIHVQEDLCLKPETSRENVLLLGDSHAANLWSAFQAKNPEKHFLQATASGCRPLLFSDGGTAWCTELYRYIYNEWIPQSSNQVTTVVLAGRWNLDEIPRLVDTAQHLKKMGKKVIVIGPTPEFFIAVPLMLAYEDIFDMSFQSYLLKRERLYLDNEMKIEMSKASIPFFSMVDVLCKNIDSRPTCLAAKDTVPMWSDRNHFTKQGSNEIIEKFKF